MDKMPLGAAVDYWPGQDPDAVWLVEGDREVTRRAVADKGNQVARHLMALGVRPGDLVTIALPNGIEFILAAIAVWKAGAIPQLVSSRLPKPERDAIVELADPAAVIGVAADEYPGHPSLPAGWVEACDGATGPVPVLEPPHFHAPCSAGSTGRPKIIVSGRAGVIDPTAAPAFGARVEGCQLIAGPLYHNGPFAFGLTGMLTGNKIVVMPRFDALTTVQLIDRHRVDWVPLHRRHGAGARRLGDAGRPRLHRRRRLHLPGRPAEGPHHLRRRQHLPGGGRRGARRPPGRRDQRGGRRARRGPRGAGPRLRRA
jgi:bile acid-coenzyme A ligase